MSVFYGSWPMVYISNLISYRPYAQRTVPGYAALRGEAATNATVTVNERPVWRNGSYFYDADGNMTSDGRFHYTWNGENRLICASNAEVVVTYAYDHRGRMVSKTLCSSAPLRLIKTTTYIWDDWNIIREVVREGDSVAVTDNIWGLDLDGTLQGAGGVGGLLAVVRDDGVFLPTYDANGNVSEYVSTNGEIVAHYDYSPFGEPLVASGPLAATFTHQFSTKPYCPVTSFSEYQMRKYRPGIGRWMSRDPIGENESVLPDDLPEESLIFLFNSNNAIRFYDVLGMATAPWGPITPWNPLPLPNPCPKRCCFGKLIQLVPIWNCTRKLAGVVEIGPIKHGYICCGGYNVNCFGIQKCRPSCMKSCLASGKKKSICREKCYSRMGDPIGQEVDPTGTCQMKCVTPFEKGRACKNPKMPWNYFVPWGHHCYAWADEMTTTNCKEQ